MLHHNTNGYTMMYSHTVLFVFILVVFCGAALGVCPAGWISSKAVGGKCYFFSRDNATMPEAQEFCEMLGKRYRRASSLVTIENNAVQSEITALMKATGRDAFWIGAEDIVQEGVFEWIGNGQNVTYFNWGPLNPNNRWGSENCVCLRYLPDQGYTYTWTDDPCSDRYDFICEMAETILNGPVIG